MIVEIDSEHFFIFIFAMSELFLFSFRAILCLCGKLCLFSCQSKGVILNTTRGFFVFFVRPQMAIGEMLCEYMCI